MIQKEVILSKYSFFFFFKNTDHCIMYYLLWMTLFKFPFEFVTDEIFSRINQDITWKPSRKRLKQSLDLENDTEQDAIETEDLSAKCVIQTNAIASSLKYFKFIDGLILQVK